MSRTRYKIFDGDITTYFITATTVNWLPLFSNAIIAEFVFESLRFLQHEKRIVIYAYVLMENHLHLIASAEDLSKQMGHFKSFTARQSIDFYLEQGNDFILDQLEFHKLPHHTDRDFQFWQEGLHPKQIQDVEMMRQKVEYIQHNLVRCGYVDLAEHWRYSSARNYAGMAGLLEVCQEW